MPDHLLSQASAGSTIVTFLPRLTRNSASSHPCMPPPMITTLFPRGIQSFVSLRRVPGRKKPQKEFQHPVELYVTYHVRAVDARNLRKSGNTAACEDEHVGPLSPRLSPGVASFPRRIFTPSLVS